MTSEDWIHKIVSRFYDKAKSDILIGYHFRNIKDFNEHIPRIATFWDLQLIGTTKRVIAEPFDVMKVHLPLNIKPGEVGRWMMLLKKTLEEESNFHPEFLDLKMKWLVKLDFFEKVFLKQFVIKNP